MSPHSSPPPKPPVPGAGGSRRPRRGEGRPDGPPARAAKKLRLQLEEKFGCGLKQKRELIGGEIEQYLQEQQNQFNRMGPADDPVTQPEPKKRKPGKGGGSALSTEMAEFLGVTELPRPQVVKALWEYIRKHGLQDPADKRKILLDDRLEKLFTPPMTMFNMNKQLSRHVFSSAALPDADGGAGKTEGKKRKAPAGKKKKAAAGNGEEGGGGRSGANFGEVLVTGPLAEVVGETRLPRTQVVKAIWEYIRKHDLQNPSDKRKILVSKDRLLASFLTEPCTMFNMNKQISPYLTKVENPNKKPKKKRAKSDGIGLQELCGVSKALEGVIGARHMKRSAIVSKIWEYIREHGLQDPSDKRNILPDKTLGKVFTNTAEAPLTMFSMNKQLSGHLIKLSDEIRAEIVGV